MTQTSLEIRQNAVVRRTEIPWEQYAAVIATLEAAKNEQFARETIRVWYEAFQQRGWTIAQIREAANTVMDTNTYGGVRFDNFVSAQKLYTEAQVEELILGIQSGRLTSFGSLDRDALKIDAISEMRTRVLRDLDNLREEFRAEFQGRVESAQSWFASAGAVDQLAVAEMVKRVRPALAKDEYWPAHWRTMCRMCMADVVDEVEAYRKSVSG